ncbi:hypothetical protein JHK87_033690 [Glycine soja]|nr:hypothetical protein JHK87_033690 [Glycine soja]
MQKINGPLTLCVYLFPTEFFDLLVHFFLLPQSLTLSHNHPIGELEELFRASEDDLILRWSTTVADNHVHLEAASPNSHEVHDEHSPYTKARYYASLKKEVYVERKRDLKDNEFTLTQETFEDKGWNKLIEQVVYSEPFVREFYANTIIQDGHKEMKSMVRGIVVKYDSMAINNLLGSTLKLRKGQQSGYEE